MSTIIESICQTLGTVINRVKTPFPTIPSVLICGAASRPGMSEMDIASNIIRRQGEAGAPTGPLPDGSQNVAEAMERIRVEEILKALRYDARIQVAIPTGAIQITGVGTSAAGVPVSITGSNVMPVHGEAIIN